MGIKPLGTSFGSLLKLLLFPSFVLVPERSILPHDFIRYFVLFHTCIYIAPEQVETTLSDKVFDGSRKVLSF